MPCTSNGPRKRHVIPEKAGTLLPPAPTESNRAPRLKSTYYGLRKLASALPKGACSRMHTKLLKRENGS